MRFEGVRLCGGLYPGSHTSLYDFEHNPVIIEALKPPHTPTLRFGAKPQLSKTGRQVARQFGLHGSAGVVLVGRRWHWLRGFVFRAYRIRAFRV